MDLVQPYSTFTFKTSPPILFSRCAVLVPSSVFLSIDLMFSLVFSQVFDPTCCLQVSV